MFFFYQTRVSEIKKKCFHIPKSNKALLTNAFFFLKKKQEKQPFLKKN